MLLLENATPAVFESFLRDEIPDTLHLFGPAVGVGVQR